MKGMVALSGLEAMSNGIQFVKNEDAALVKWGKKNLPKWMGLWNFYSGKSGIGRIGPDILPVLRWFDNLLPNGFCDPFRCIRWHVGSYPGWKPLLLSVLVNSRRRDLFLGVPDPGSRIVSGSFDDCFAGCQATEWRDVAIGEIPEIIVYRDPRGTFTRSVTITFAVAVFIMFLVRGKTTAACPIMALVFSCRSW